MIRYPLSDWGWKTATLGSLTQEPLLVAKIGGILENCSAELGLKKIYSKLEANNADDLIFRNQALFELGSLYMEKCDFPNAVDCLEKVKAEALKFELFDNYFRANSMLQRVHAERLDFTKHEELLQEVLRVGSSLQGFERYAPKFHYNQGIASMYRGSYTEAAENFSMAEKLAAEALQHEYSAKDRDELRRDRISARYGVAVIKKDQKKYSEALEITAALHREIAAFVEASEANEPPVFSDLEASVKILEGHCYRDLGQYQNALDRYWEAHGILKSNRNWSYYYYVLLGLGRVYAAMGNNDRAQIFFDLILDAVGNLELNALKQTLDQVSKARQETNLRLFLDRERKVIVESALGEVQFERRFVLLEIFYLLSEKPGHVFSKEDLVSQVWREEYNPMIHDSKVYTSISRLRKLLEPDFKHPVYILNERDGYSFNPNVRVEEMGQRNQFRPKMETRELEV